MVFNVNSTDRRKILDFQVREFYKKYSSFKSNVKLLYKKNLDVYVPGVFVSKFNYPNINAGFVVPLSGSIDSKKFDSPKFWFENNVSLNKILEYRVNTFNFSSDVNAKFFSKSKNLELLQLSTISKKPSFLNVNFEKFKILFKPHKEVVPFGGKVFLNKVVENENISVEKHAGKVFYDTDFKAEDAVLYLKKFYDEHEIINMFSSAVMGVKEQRRFVPTRWSITAVDSIISNNFSSKIRSFDNYDFNLLFFDREGYMGNFYYVLVFKGPFMYELFEIDLDNNQVWYDYELTFGRKKYPESTVGGYFAAKNSIVKKLYELNIKGSILVFRIIKNYNTPLGVWIVRKAVEKVMNNKVEFESRKVLLDFTVAHIKKYFSFDISSFVKKSKILDFLDKQKNLKSFY